MRIDARSGDAASLTGNSALARRPRLIHHTVHLSVTLVRRVADRALRTAGPKAIGAALPL
jgi:hypothetical protein